MSEATVTATAPAFSEEEALWRAIGANPQDDGLRKIVADWYEERDGRVRCPQCGGAKVLEFPGGGRWTSGNPYVVPCEPCHATGVVSNGYADLAAALRATADLWPLLWNSRRLRAERVYLFTRAPDWGEAGCEFLSSPVFDALTGASIHGEKWRNYPTAADAVRDLCRAWLKANREGD